MPTDRYVLNAGIPVFQMASGKFAGRTFRHGREYQAIPKGYETRFTNKGGGVKRAPDKKPPQQQTPTPTKKKRGMNNAK